MPNPANIEIICCNDCSTDNSLNIIKRYQEQHKHIRCIQNKENMGLFDTRIALFKESKGDYIYNLDSDDWLSPITIETMVNATSRGSIDVVKAHLTQVFPTRIENRTLNIVGTQEATLFGHDIIATLKKHGRDLQIVHTLIHTKFLPVWIQQAESYAGRNILMAEDQIFTLLLVQLINSYRLLNIYNLYFYRRTPYSSVGMMSKSPSLMINHAKSMVILQEILQDTDSWILFEHHKKILHQDINNYGYKNFSSQDLKTLTPLLETLDIKG